MRENIDIGTPPFSKLELKLPPFRGQLQASMFSSGGECKSILRDGVRFILRTIEQCFGQVQ